MKKQKATRLPVVILVAGGILLIFAVFLFTMQTRPNPDDSQPTAPVSNQEEGSYPEIQRVSLGDAKAALDANTAVFVDVRDAGSFAEGHVPGSLSIPLVDLEDRLSELDTTDWIITYCT